MKKYIIKRVLSMIPVFFIASLVIFSIIHLAPGDPAQVILGDGATGEEVALLRERMGLDDPLPLQYVKWVGNLLRGDLGESIFINQPMGQILSSHLKVTLSLSFFALVVAVLIGMPLGILAARHRGRFLDHFSSGFALMGMSLPNFIVALLMMLVFAYYLRWFPVAGYKPLTDGLGQHLRYLTIPAISLGLMHSALIARMTRSSMLEVLNSDYIKMARSKGVKERNIMLRHALKNALLPIITVIAQITITLLAGAVVCEAIFNIPGIGQLIVSSINRRDYSLIQALVLVIAVINMVVMLLVDILYAFIDPRIRLEA